MAESNPVLDLVLKKAEETRKASIALRDREVQNAMAAEVIISQAVVDTEKLGQAKIVEETAKQTGQMIAQDQARAAINQAQGFETLSALLSRTTRTAQRMTGEIEAVRKEQIESTGFNPLAAVKLALDWSGNKTRLEQTMSELQAINGAAQMVGNQVSQVGRESRANAQVITNASIEASAQQTALTASIQAAELRLKGLAANTQGVTAVAAASDRDLQLATGVGNFARAEAGFQLQLEEEQRRREQFSWQKEQAAAVREEKLDEKGFEERTIQYINLGEAARGLPPSSSREIKDMIKLNKGLSQDYAELYQNGKIAARTGQALISNSPGKVAAILSQDPTLLSQLDEQQKKVAALVLNAKSVLVNKETGKLKPEFEEDKTGVKANRAITQEVQTSVQRQLAFVGNNPDSVFFLGEPSAYIGSRDAPGVSAFQKYTLTKKVFEPAIAAGNSLSDVSVPYKLTLEAIKRGEINSSQAAADFSNIYKRMNALHRAGSDFKKFAISLPPDGATYRVKIDGEIVDVTDFVAVAQAMNRSLSKQAFDAKPTIEKVFPPSGAFGRVSQGTR